MDTANTQLIFLVNHTESQRTSFSKQKYLTEIAGTLINIYKLIIHSQTITE